MAGHDSMVDIPGMWMFTFGGDARMTIRGEHDTGDAGAGVPIGHRYILVRADTETKAREEFIRVFGPGRFAEVRPYNGASQRLIRKRNMVVLVATLVAP